jgi:hypothetical protein
MFANRLAGLPWLMGLACGLLLLMGGSSVLAHEVDQFTVPEDQEFADLGDYFNDYFITAIEEGMRRTNRRIDVALGGDGKRFKREDRGYGAGALWTYDTSTSGQTLGYLYSGEAVANYVRKSIPDAVTLIEGLERELHSRAVKDQYPGEVVAYHPSDFTCVYAKAHFPLDPRSVFRLWRASSIKVNGTYAGTDKMGHFVDMGYNYYKVYTRLRTKRGLSERKAMDGAMHAFDTGLLSESSVLGYGTAGAYSNGDMAANYVGCLFYRNLTGPVRLKGKLRPPIVVRDGDYWRLNDYVKGEPDFFSWFISDHYDEALNPSHFEKGMQKAMRRAIAERCLSLMRWYAPEGQEMQTAEYFQNKMYELVTYYNSDYGHSRKFDELINLGDIYLEDFAEESSDQEP